jgi:RNA polymerase sigma-70 factor (ECF subfamily)
MIWMMSLPLVPLLPLSSGAAATADAKDVDRAEPVMAEEEFRAFYERTARPLWAYLSRITGDPHAADDALQEAYYRFYKAGKAGSRHESESHRRNSLFRIATNVVRDAGRRAAVRRHVPLAEGAAKPDTPVGGTPVPERRAAGRADLARALRELDPTQRQILWLAYAQGASHQEIAETVGVRAISVRTMLLRARRKAAAALRRESGPDRSQEVES